MNKEAKDELFHEIEGRKKFKKKIVCSICKKKVEVSNFNRTRCNKCGYKYIGVKK